MNLAHQSVNLRTETTGNLSNTFVGTRLALLRCQEENMKDSLRRLYEDETGAMGYILLWAMGVPAFVLVAIFVLRGCH